MPGVGLEAVSGLFDVAVQPASYGLRPGAKGILVQAVQVGSECFGGPDYDFLPSQVLVQEEEREVPGNNSSGNIMKLQRLFSSPPSIVAR